jgi:hypothetical protein
LKGYKIYRSSYQIRRKGVAILIKSSLEIICNKILDDEIGRYVKVQIRNKTTGQIWTISSIYGEPGLELDGANIPESIMTSDIIGGT